MDVPVLSPAHAAAWSESMTVAGVDAPLAYAYIPDRPTAVVGLSQSIERELNLDACRADGLRLMRRASGGGAVLLYDGVLCFGVITPAKRLTDGGRIHAAFRELTAHVVDALADFGIAARSAGISDISAPHPDIPGQYIKLAGTAQLRKKHAVLVHGSLLVNADLSLLERYLAFPSEVPDYRAGRSHLDFCRNAADLSQSALTLHGIADALCTHARRKTWNWADVPHDLHDGAALLLAEKYTVSEWTFSRKRPRS